MTVPTPQPYAVRAVNQYRRRDIFPYLALRYYLANSATLGERWTPDIAARMVLRRVDQPYLRVLHFKELGEHGIEHRELHVPCANESIAEAFLLDQCARKREFDLPDCVYSYELSGGDETAGVFAPYYAGFKRREHDIERACRKDPDAVVQYLDVRKFYPSVRCEAATRSWLIAAARADLPSTVLSLGEKLLSDYQRVPGNGQGELLTGPMFSHLLGNLIMGDLDREYGSGRTVRYFRYVDDIVLIGPRDAVHRLHADLVARLDDLGLKLHPPGSPKHRQQLARDWLHAVRDLPDDAGHAWMCLIGDTKRFLLAQPEAKERLASALAAEDFRLPLLDYSEAVRERTFLRRFRQLKDTRWLRSRLRRTSIQSILLQAHSLRQLLQQEIERRLGEYSRESGNETRNKRIVSRIRFCAGRLAYLGGRGMLPAFAEELRRIDELKFHAEVLHAVGTCDVTTVVALGANATQAAGQVLRAAGLDAELTHAPEGDGHAMALAVLLMNGVKVRGTNTTDQSEVLELASKGASVPLMRSTDAFVSEITCLHGIEPARHPHIMETAFDEDEALPTDAVRDEYSEGSG